MHGYSRPVRCSLLAIPTVLNLFIFPPHIYVRVTFRLLLLYLSRMPIKLLKKKKKKKKNVRICLLKRKFVNIKFLPSIKFYFVCCKAFCGLIKAKRYCQVEAFLRF